MNGRNQENTNKESYMWRVVKTELKIQIKVMKCGWRRRNNI
jgi:hypothetical protein